MKTIRLITGSLLLISGVLHVFFAFKFKGVTNNALAYWMGDGILYLVIGVLFLIKKRFAFWLGLIPIIVSLFASYGSGYKDLINAMYYIDLITVICCMALLLWKRDAKSIKRFRWTLRMLSGLIIVFALYMFIGETFFGENPGKSYISTDAIIGFSIWGIGLIGLGLAWKWELIGSIISLVAFVVYGINEPGTWTSFMLVWPAIAILFIVLWAISRNTTLKNS